MNLARIWNAAMARAVLTFIASLTAARILAIAPSAENLSRDDMPHMFLLFWLVFTAILVMTCRTGRTIWRTMLAVTAGICGIAALSALFQPEGQTGFGGMALALLVIGTLAGILCFALSPGAVPPPRRARIGRR